MPGALRLLVPFLDVAIDSLEQRGIARIPVLKVAALARLIEVAAAPPTTPSTFFCLTISSTSSPTFRSASIFAFQSTGSASSFALICAGDNSAGFGALAVVLVSGRRERTRDLEEVHAFRERHGADPDLVPVLLRLRHRLDGAVRRATILTASKILSDAGSSMSRISSFTDTIGLRSPHS